MVWFERYSEYNLNNISIMIISCKLELRTCPGIFSRFFNEFIE